MRKIMSSGRLSRRTFVQAGAAAALMPLLHSRAARAVTGGKTVNVADFYKDNWPQAFKLAFNEAQTVEVPESLTCDNINSPVFMPAGKTLRVLGALKGNGKGRFILQDGCQILGEKKGACITSSSTCAARRWRLKASR